MSDKEPLESVYVLERPVWGMERWTPGEYREHADAIEALLPVDGVAVLRYHPLEERSVLRLLLSMAGRLRTTGRSVQFYEPDISLEGLGRLPDGVTTIHNLDAAPDVLDLLFDLTPGQLVVATLAEDRWPRWEEQLRKIGIKRRYWRSPLLQVDPDLTEAAVSQETDRRVGLAGQLWDAVLISDALGTPLPLSMWARAFSLSLERAEALADELAGLAFPVAVPQSQDLYLSTRGRVLALSAARTLFSAEHVRSFVQQLVTAADPGRREHRHAAAKLLGGTPRLLGGRGAIELFTACQARVRELWARAPAGELLAWGAVLGETGLFESATEAISLGRVRDQENPYLAHAYARLLGEWAVVDRRKLGQARAAFRRIRPRGVYILQSWAHMERETGHLLEAQELLQEAHREDPDNTYVLIEQALVGHELGTTNAEALLHAIEPESPYARHVQGVSAADRGAYEEAEGLFASILQSDPRHLPTLTAWARMALDRGHLRTAADLLTRALQVDPENPHAVHMRAELFELQGKHDEALRMLEDLLAVQQANVKVLVALGTLLAKLHRADEARRRFETALEIDPHNVHALTALAGVALDAGDLGPAEAYIEEALRRTRAGKLSPAAPLNVRAKIVAERSLGRPNPSPAASYALMEESLSIAKTVGMVLGRIKTLNTWVQVALRFQDLHTAVARVQMSRELDPRNAYTLELAAKVFRARGQPGDTDLGEALEQAAQEIRESPAH